MRRRFCGPASSRYPEGQIEAAKSLGLSRYRIIRHVVLVPAVRAVYPSLSAQFILQIMGTSIVGAIAAEELTAVANNLVMQTFRSFEVYIVIAVIYFVVVQAASLLFAGIGKLHVPLEGLDHEPARFRPQRNDVPAVGDALDDPSGADRLCRRRPDRPGGSGDPGGAGASVALAGRRLHPVLHGHAAS